jgi:hypothetical protein
MATDLFLDIKKRAKDKGLSLDALQQEVGISHMTLQKWKVKVPKSIEILQRINDILNKE